jgi:hypothetical protein
MAPSTKAPPEKEREEEREQFSSLSFCELLLGRKENSRARSSGKNRRLLSARSLPYYLNPFLYAEKISPTAQRLSFFLELAAGAVYFSAIFLICGVMICASKQVAPPYILYGRLDSHPRRMIY